jgi:hypothetical protein
MRKSKRTIFQDRYLCLTLAEGAVTNLPAVALMP